MDDFVHRMDKEMDKDMVCAKCKGDNVVTLQIWREVTTEAKLEFLILALVMTVCTADHSQTCPAMRLPTTRIQFTAMSTTRMYRRRH